MAVSPTVKVLVTVAVVVAVNVVDKEVGPLMLIVIPPTLMIVLSSKYWFMIRGKAITCVET